MWHCPNDKKSRIQIWLRRSGERRDGLLRIHLLRAYSKRSDRCPPGCEWSVFMGRKTGKFQAVISRNENTFELEELKPGDLLFWTGTYEVEKDPPITHTMIISEGKRKRISGSWSARAMAAFITANRGMALGSSISSSRVPAETAKGARRPSSVTEESLGSGRAQPVPAIRASFSAR